MTADTDWAAAQILNPESLPISLRSLLARKGDLKKKSGFFFHDIL